MNATNGNEKKVSLENIAYEQLKNAIVVGIYPPGIQIVEEQIANQLNISRSPVRIAIKRLEAEGFLDRYSNKRIYVAFADAKRTIDALYIREALEGMAARSRLFLLRWRTHNQDRIPLFSIKKELTFIVCSMSLPTTRSWNESASILSNRKAYSVTAACCAITAVAMRCTMSTKSSPSMSLNRMRIGLRKPRATIFVS